MCLDVQVCCQILKLLQQFTNNVKRNFTQPKKVHCILVWTKACGLKDFSGVNTRKVSLVNFHNLYFCICISVCEDSTLLNFGPTSPSLSSLLGWSNCIFSPNNVHALLILVFFFTAQKHHLFFNSPSLLRRLSLFSFLDPVHLLPIRPQRSDLDRRHLHCLGGSAVALGFIFDQNSTPSPLFLSFSPFFNGPTL